MLLSLSLAALRVRTCLLTRHFLVSVAFSAQAERDRRWPLPRAAGHRASRVCQENGEK
jgi:hypothetical protein